MNKKQLEKCFMYFGIGSLFFLLFMSGGLVMDGKAEYSVLVLLFIVLLFIAGYLIDELIKNTYNRVKQ